MSEATVIALGFFDGVHLGHGALLRKTAERARELGVTPAAFTFDRSPKEFVTGVPVPLLTSAAERAEIIREYYGIGTVFVEPFDRAMMTMPWEDFITELLVKSTAPYTSSRGMISVSATRIRAIRRSCAKNAVRSALAATSFPRWSWTA